MSKEYSCNLCKMSFSQKIDFTRHKNKKTSCVTSSDLQQINEKKDTKEDNKTTLINIFKSCLNILRDNEGLTGEKALRTLSYLLILKLLEPHFGASQVFGDRINIDDYEYDFSHIEDSMIDEYKTKLLQIARFSNLSKEKEDNISINMKYLWDDILSNHPTTKNIFLKGKGFDIQHKSTYKKLIDKLNSLDLSKTGSIARDEYDVLGNAYEEVIQDIMTGKVLGQYFTQPLVKKMMVKLINPQIHPDGKIDTCGDPTMGTGGFLITYLQYVLQEASKNNINPDWNFIKTEGLYGKELEPDTYQLAVSNMLISSGHMFENLDRGDSIRVPITRKFDNVLANPPFGIKGLEYDDIQSSLKSEYVPIKTDNAVSLFIQAIIYMLKLNGKCAIVLPDGRDLFSKTNTTLVAIREYLMKTCDLKEIINLPSGIFTYTPIKTCVFYFIKKKEGSEVLKTKIKQNKTQKETGRHYEFSNTYQTTTVKFYDYNPYEDIKKLLVEVPIEKIANNFYSLNYAEYMKNETVSDEKNENIISKTLGEVCNIEYGTRIVKSNNTEGDFPVFGSGRATFTTNNFNREGYNILVGRFALSAECVRFVNEKIFLNDSGLSVKPKTDIILHKYLGYYLLHNQNIIYGCARGTAQKNLEIEEFKSIKIVIPSIDIQQQIIKYLDFVYEKTIKTSNDKIQELRQLNEFCINNQKFAGQNTWKKLAEICEFLPKSKRQASYGSPEGAYPFFTSSQTCNKYCEECDYKDECLIIGTGGSANIKCSSNFSCSTDNFVIKIKSEYLTKFIYYYFATNLDILQNGFVGSGLKHISKEYVNNINVIIPTLDRQKEIVEYCEYNDNLIRQLEQEIENNKKQAKQFLTSILRSKEQVKKIYKKNQKPHIIEDDEVTE